MTGDFLDLRINAGRFRQPWMSTRIAVLELCHLPDTGILCFRTTPAGFPERELNRLRKYVYDNILADGRRSIAMTKLDGTTVLRFLVISPKVTSEVLLETIEVVRTLAENYPGHP